MDVPGRLRLAEWLATPTRVNDLSGIADGWRDLDCRVLLGPTGTADSAFGAHLRRSFLAALAPGASDQARHSKPCPWDPPCALDVFLREQLRAGGDGLPKPYVLFWDQEGQAMQVTLRIFGTACDWGAAAADALTAALRELPWRKALHCTPPRPLHREVGPCPWIDVPEGPLTLRLVSSMDDEGSADKGRDIAARILSRALRRIDALARWQGLGLEDDAMRALTAQVHALRATDIRLRPGQHLSPNAAGQKRHSRVLTGEFDLPDLPDDLRLLLSLALRCHVGRHTNEGLGRLSVRVKAGELPLSQD
ncbi:MAG: hypothetical protein JJT81_20550 [Rubellimicrobium sp.]|nr:hypothetical protein [Rubellimicrobium sp.]